MAKRDLKAKVVLDIRDAERQLARLSRSIDTQGAAGGRGGGLRRVAGRAGGLRAARGIAAGGRLGGFSRLGAGVGIGGAIAAAAGIAVGFAGGIMPGDFLTLKEAGKAAPGLIGDLMRSTGGVTTGAREEFVAVQARRRERAAATADMGLAAAFATEAQLEPMKQVALIRANLAGLRAKGAERLFTATAGAAVEQDISGILKGLKESMDKFVANLESFVNIATTGNELK